MFGDDFDVMLYVRDIGRSVDFYHGVLGFEFQGWWSEEQEEYVKEWDAAGRPGYAELSAGAARISLHASDGKVSPGECIFHLRVMDVDTFYSAVADRGGDLSKPKDEPWGWRMSFLEDPDGHEWGFWAPVGND